MGDCKHPPEVKYMTDSGGQSPDGRWIEIEACIVCEMEYGQERAIELAVKEERNRWQGLVELAMLDLKEVLPDHNWACHYPDGVPVCEPPCKPCDIMEALRPLLNEQAGDGGE